MTMTPAEFIERAIGDPVGGAFVYYSGNLAIAAAVHRDVHELARLALQMSDDGKVHLMQRKIYEGCYEYLAAPASERARAMRRARILKKHPPPFDPRHFKVRL